VSQEVEYYLIAQEVKSTVQGRKVFSTYTTEAGIRGMVVHMLEGKRTCTRGAMIHKVVVWRWGHKRDTEGAYQQILMHM
jgi:hypothetical protein